MVIMLKMNSMKKVNIFIYIGIGIILIWILIFNTQYGSNKRSEEIYNYYRELEFQDLVTSVGYDRSDHNSPKLFMKTSSMDLSFLENKDEILQKTKSGDSIKKEFNQLSIIIINTKQIKKIYLKVHRIN